MAEGAAKIGTSVGRGLTTGLDPWQLFLVGSAFLGGVSVSAFTGEASIWLS